MFEHVLDVRDHQVERRVAIVTAVRTQEARGEVETGEAAGFADRRQLLVGQIARVRADRVGVGVRRDQRRIRDLGNVPKAALIEVRQIDQNPQPVAGADQRLAEIGQTGAGIGRGRTAERHAVAEHIRPAPHRPKRAQPRCVQHVKQFEIRIDCFGAFDMQHRRQRAVGEAAFDIGNSPANTNAPVRLPLDPEQQRRHGKHHALRFSGIDSRRRRIVTDDAAGLLRSRFAVGAIFPFRRRHEDREQAAGKSSLERLGKIQMALLLALQKRRHRIRTAAHMQPEQDVVVAVEDRNGLGWGHLRPFVAQISGPS